MTIGFLFWLLMILWFVFGLVWTSPGQPSRSIAVMGPNVILFLIIFLLGWRCFGFVIQG